MGMDDESSLPLLIDATDLSSGACSMSPSFQISSNRQMATSADASFGRIHNPAVQRTGDLPYLNPHRELLPKAASTAQFVNEHNETQKLTSDLQNAKSAAGNDAYKVSLEQRPCKGISKPWLRAHAARESANRTIMRREDGMHVVESDPDQGLPSTTKAYNSIPNVLGSKTPVSVANTTKVDNTTAVDNKVQNADDPTASDQTAQTIATRSNENWKQTLLRFCGRDIHRRLKTTAGCYIVIAYITAIHFIVFYSLQVCFPLFVFLCINITLFFFCFQGISEARCMGNSLIGLANCYFGGIIRNKNRRNKNYFVTETLP